AEGSGPARTVRATGVPLSRPAPHTGGIRPARGGASAVEVSRTGGVPTARSARPGTTVPSSRRSGGPVTSAGTTSSASETESGVAATIATVAVTTGVVLGLALAAFPVLGHASGTPGLAGGAIVSGVFTAVVLRRGFGFTWKDATVAGGVAAGVLFGSATGPGWPPGWPQALAGYTLAVAGGASVLLTVPVRRLSGLPVEYGVVVAV